MYSLIGSQHNHIIESKKNPSLNYEAGWNGEDYETIHTAVDSYECDGESIFVHLEGDYDAQDLEMDVEDEVEQYDICEDILYSIAKYKERNNLD